MVSPEIQIYDSISLGFVDIFFNMAVKLELFFFNK